MYMDAKKQTSSKEPDTGQQIAIDISKMYQFRPDEMIPDIRASSYSNVSYITCTNRDVFIDFLEMPGIKKDGKMMIPGTGSTCRTPLPSSLPQSSPRCSKVLISVARWNFFSPNRENNLPPERLDKYKVTFFLYLH